METGRHVYASLYDSMVGGLGARITPAVKAAVRAEGLDLDHPPHRIPVELATRVVHRLAEHVFPGVERAEALRQLGYHSIHGWQRTMVGTAVGAMLRLVGPDRTLTRLDQALRTTSDYCRATTVKVAAREALVTVNEVDGVPTYWVGIFQAGLELMGLEGSVALEREQPPGAVFRLKWR